MPRKPLLIIVIAVCFLVSPIFILLQVSLYTLTPVIGYNNIFAKLSPHDALILCLYPVCAAAVFFVKKWGWYVYLSAALCLVVDNIVVFALRPQYHLLALVAYNLILVAAAGVFFRRAVIAPYFNPSLRWWEQPRRYVIRVFLEVGGESAARAEVVDLSETGAFVVCPAALPSGRTLPVMLHAFSHRIELAATVRRREERGAAVGYGLQFARTGPVERTALRALLRDLGRAGLVNRERKRAAAARGLRRTAPRFRLNLGAAIAGPSGDVPAVVVNLSRAGCLLGVGESAVLKPFRLHLHAFGHKVSVACEARWIGCWEGIPVCGAVFRFDDPGQKRLVRRILAVSRRAGAVDRLKSASPLPDEKLYELALHSPYRIVNRARSLFVKR